MVTVKDANGNYVAVNDEDFRKALTDNIETIYGMSLECIAAARYIYIKKGGAAIITPESIKETLK